MKTVKLAFVGSFLVILTRCCSKGGNSITPVIPVAPTITYKLKLNGSANSCSGSSLTNGNVIIITNNGYVPVHVTNGLFDTTLQSNYSFDTVRVWAIDLNSLTTSDTLKVAVVGNSMNLGQISTCAGSVDEFIKCNIGNDSIVYVPNLYDPLRAGSSDTFRNVITYFTRTLGSTINNKFWRMQFSGLSTGSFGMDGNCGFYIGRYYAFNMPPSGRITYTAYGNVGGYITGSLNMPFLNNNDSLNYLLTGSFKVRRDY